MVKDKHGNDLPDPLNVNEMFAARFDSPVTSPRSSEYKAGFKSGITRQVHKAEDELHEQVATWRGKYVCPFNMGTVQADAWLSGFDEGVRYQGYCQTRFAELILGEFFK